MRTWVLCIAALLAAPQAPAQNGPDLHDYWDQRCRSCHGEAGAFARSTLSVRDGRLLGVHHRDDLERFLRQHYLAEDWVRPVMAMLAAQVTTDPLFQARCASCHGRASDFARESLAWRDGVLIGRTGQQPVAATLRSHGGLAPAEAAAMVGTLQRVLGEVSGRSR